MPDSQRPVGQKIEATNGSTIQNVTQVYAEHLHLRSSHLSDEQLAALRRGHNVPPLPDHYLPREAFLDPLRRALLADGAATLGIVGVHGMGGIGKSVLAAALARDPQVQAAFPDGIVWLPIGREPNLPARQEDLYLILTGERENFKDAAQGRFFLANALNGKACLVILDDVWETRHAEAFPRLPEGSKARYLLTTRIGEVLQTLGAQAFSLDVLEPEQALCLLADWAGQPVEELPPEAREVAKECGYLPLALAMVGAFVRQNPESWARALRRLQKADLESLRRLFPGYEHPTLLAALQVSVEALPERARERYLDLAVFPEEAAIPPAILRAFWAPLGLDEDDVADLLDTLVGRSLARRDKGGALNLHDLQHDYLRAALRDELPALHRRFLLACAQSLLDERAQDLAGLPWRRLPPETPYLWDHLIRHHIAAGAWDALYRLLTDFDFLEARCRASSVFDLEADYRLTLAHWPAAEAERKAVLAAFEERLRLEDYHIAPYPDYLFPALYNHLTWLDAPDGPLHALCEAVRTGRKNWLRSVQDPRPQPPPWLRSLEGHTGSVTAVAVSADGRTVVSGSRDRTVKVWEAETGRLLHSLEGHTDGVQAVAVSADGRLIISGSADRTVKVWEAESGRLLRSLEGHTAWVLAVALSADGRTVVSGSADRTVKVWEAETGRLLRALEGHRGGVNAVALSADGRTVISGSGDGTVKVWEAETGRLLRSLEGHTGSVNAVALSADGRTLVSGADDGTVKVWEAQTGRLLRSLEGHTDSVTAVAVSADGRFIVSGLSDGTVKVWETETGRLRRSLAGHTDSVRAVALSADGRTVVSASVDQTVKVWEAETGRLRRSLAGHTGSVTAVALSADGRMVVSGLADGTVKVWDWETGRLVRSLEGHTDSVTAVAVSADGRTVVSASVDHTVKVWEAETGRLRRALEGHAKEVTAVAVSADGRTVVSGSDDGTVKVWETETGRLLRSLEEHTDRVRAVALSADGGTIFSGANGWTVKVWEAETGRLLRALEGHTGLVNAVALSADGRTIVSGSDDRTVKVWEAETGRLLRSLEGHTDYVRAVALSADGRTIVSGSDDRTVKVWEAETGRLLRSLEGHTDDVNAVALSADGRTIVSGSRDRTVWAWDLESGRARLLFWNDAPVYSLALSRDDHTLSCGDGAGRVWIFEWVQ